MNNKLKPVARKNDLVVQDADGEILVYDLVTNKASCLNDTAAFVWQNCDGSNGIADIAAALGRKTNAAVNDDLVWLAIDKLSESNLLEKTVTPEYSFAGAGRREMIKKIGLGAVIALPVIATLTAPTAAHAASACGQVCNNPADCSGIAGCTNCNPVAGPGGGRVCGA